MPDQTDEILADRVEWYQNEVLYLQDEIEDVQGQIDEVTAENEDLQERADKAEGETRRIKFKMESAVDEKNKQLMNRMLACTDVIQEMDRLIRTYVKHSQVTLTTTKLNELRKKGGLGPI